MSSVLGVVDFAWRLRVVLRSRLVDGEYYAAQRGWRITGDLRAAVDYVARGFREGLSPNSLFDELFAGRELPDLGKVPALYAYLVSDRVSVRVHPWWTTELYAMQHAFEGGAIEHAWSHRASAVVTASVGGWSRELAVLEWRKIVLESARERNLGELRDSEVDVTRVLQGLDRRHDEKIAPAVGTLRGASVHLACVGVEPSAWSSVAIAVAACSERGGITATRLADDTSFSELIGVVTARTEEGVIVMLDPRAALPTAEIEQLAVSGSRAMVTPAVVAADGTVASAGAGMVLTPSGPRLSRFLGDHPKEDLKRLQGRDIEVPLLHGRTFGMPARLLRAATRMPLDAGWELETISARVYEYAKSVPLLVNAEVTVSCFSPEYAFATAATTHIPAELAARAADPSLLSDLHQAAGFAVESWQAVSPTEAQPYLHRVDKRKRWAIKTCAPAGPTGEAWGDTHFARGLANALRRLGHEVVIDARTASNRATTYLDDVHLVIRGPYPIAPPANGISIEWIISHPDEITREETAAFDFVFAVSASWARRAAEEWGREVGHLLEATDIDLFRGGASPRGEDLVFVGTARGIPRPSVVAPLAAGIDVKVYGPDWRGFIPPEAIVAPGIPNSDLPELYRAAGAVLNDQWPAMRREGFIAMRPFDVVAAGGRVISESVEGLHEIFGGALVEYETPEQLVQLLRGELDRLFASESELSIISARIRVEHSFDARAATLDATIRKFAGDVQVH